jgi:D-glycero-D-manno-heptose 1,7-bisphosphate phosphatase
VPKSRKPSSRVTIVGLASNCFPKRRDPNWIDQDIEATDRISLTTGNTINTSEIRSLVILRLPLSRAVFLDRDGVLTREKQDYVKTPDELEILPGLEAPLREIQKRGFRIVIITNQSVIGRGLTTHREMSMIHEKLRLEVERFGCSIDGIYYCPHLPDEGCNCRKPEPGLILKAAKDLGIDVATSWMIGDKEIDLEAAKRAGCRGIRIHTNGTGLADAVRQITYAEEHSNGVGAS